MFFSIAETHKASLRLIFSVLDLASKPQMLMEEKSDLSCLKDRLSTSNQVFLRALLKSRNTNRVITVCYDKRCLNTLIYSESIPFYLF